MWLLKKCREKPWQTATIYGRFGHVSSLWHLGGTWGARGRQQLLWLPWFADLATKTTLLRLTEMLWNLEKDVKALSPGSAALQMWLWTLFPHDSGATQRAGLSEVPNDRCSPSNFQTGSRGQIATNNKVLTAGGLL